AVKYNSSRGAGIIVSESIFAAAVTVGLNYLWYKKFPHSKFHLFNDDNEWLNMDKAGHATTAYNIAAIQSDIFQWAGLKRGPASAIGSLTALSFMTMIEILDGHSSKWGFSIGDMAANFSGCLLFQGQQWLWNEQRISLKFSYHYTMFARYYPQELGKTWSERILKDYNGQTYWLSLNIASFLPAASSFPKWLNASIGYGAEGMIGAVKNPAEVNGVAIPEFKRYRQFYFSFDTDLYRVDRLSYTGTTILSINRTLKMLAPALEYNPVNGFIWHWLYY
ncbi:MAG TPA: DUF2279 domain-containing protein, partial [Puia sp.]|nr:DUF2279 domain-containing protein [Puia sp.]